LLHSSRGIYSEMNWGFEIALATLTIADFKWKK
jgi:hypothetical protein